MIDYAVIGGGIIGVSTAMRLLQVARGASVVLIEKESRLAEHQTGHNSGVIHAGVYYAPGSLKAKFCRIGAEATVNFCTEKGIPYERCGKLIVAVDESEVARLDALAERCTANGISFEKMDKAEIKRREPNIRGEKAILVHATGITSYKLVVEAMRAEIVARGGDIRLNSKVLDIRESSDAVELITSKETLKARQVIVCAGLQADRMARKCGIKMDFRIVPFRGEYFQLPASRNGIVRHLIYPVPDPTLPFLGVHLTRTIDGSVTVGPNAVLGFSREGYPRFSFTLSDALTTATFPGFWKMASGNARVGFEEMLSSISRRRYLSLCRRYCPDLTLSDLYPYPAGIRAQAIMRDGSMLHDFLIRRTERTLHVCNAPSPAATSAFPIGEHIVDTLLSTAS